MKAMVKASLLGLVALGASCSGGAEDSLAGPTESIEAAVTTTASIAPETTVSSSTTSTEAESEAPADEEAAVRAAFEEYRRVVQAVNEVPDASDPRLFDVAVGPLLNAHLESLQRWDAASQSVEHPEDSVASAEVLNVEFSNGRAVLTVCRVGDSYLLNSLTGERSEEGTTTRVRIYTAVPAGDNWLMESATDIDVVEGVGGCASS